ncbi:MAG: undecaprenyl-diphosphate phosphatase [Myxococcota bacterium]
MTVLQALALGVLQGATEFLPVSSSGHLVLAENYLSQPSGPGLLFAVVVHFGTVLAILWILRERVLRLLRAAGSLVPGGRLRAPDPTDRRWLLLLLVGSLPTALIGLALRDVVEHVHAEPSWVGACLMATAVILVISELTGRRTRGAAELRISDALLVGSVQGLAVLPGLSRSGSTVGAALWRDVRAETAVEFSMLLSVPAVLGANALEFARAGLGAARAELVPLVAGFVAAFISGALCLKVLQWAVVRRKLRPFAAYCALVGAGAMIFG